MSAKAETASFETIVTEALARMKDATAATPSYEVDRSNGQWIVRRASTTSARYWVPWRTEPCRSTQTPVVVLMRARGTVSEEPWTAGRTCDA